MQDLHVVIQENLKLRKLLELQTGIVDEYRSFLENLGGEITVCEGRLADTDNFEFPDESIENFLDRINSTCSVERIHLDYSFAYRGSAKKIREEVEYLIKAGYENE